MNADYTKLAVGTDVNGKTIQKCPHCGRNGLLEVTDGKNWYVHSESADAPDAMSARLNFDMCPKIS